MFLRTGFENIKKNSNTKDLNEFILEMGMMFGYYLNKGTDGVKFDRELEDFLKRIGLRYSIEDQDSIRFLVISDSKEEFYLELKSEVDFNRILEQK